MPLNSTVLIIDDEPVNHEIYTSILADLCQTLEFAQTGSEGLEKAANLEPDLIILDVMMPQKDGFEICQELRTQNSKLVSVPILLITALNDKPSRLKGFSVGADDFISKPLDRLELRTRVRGLLRLNRYRNLLNEQERFAWIAEQTQDGLIVLDEQDNILFLNGKARGFLGLNPDELSPSDISFRELAERHYQLHPAEAWEQWPQQSDLKTQQSHYLLQPETEQSEAVWLEVEIFLQKNAQGQERLLHLKNVSREMARSRNQFFFQTSVSHKLRTPLNSLLGSLQILDFYIEKEKAKDLLKTCLTQAYDLAEYIDKITQFINSKSLVGEQPQTRVEDLLELFLENAHSQAVEEIQIDCSDDLKPLNIRISPLALEYILLELIVNAQKFHPNKTPKLELKIEQSSENVLSISLLDDGLSLSAEEAQLAWQPYFQADKHFSGQVEGLGLGLTMVASVILQIGGTHFMHARRDKPGMIVGLNLPLVSSMHQESPQAELSLSSTNPQISGD